MARRPCLRFVYSAKYKFVPPNINRTICIKLISQRNPILENTLLTKLQYPINQLNSLFVYCYVIPERVNLCVRVCAPVCVCALFVSRYC